MSRLAYVSVPVLLAAAFTAGCASAEETSSPPSIVTELSSAPTPPASPEAAPPAEPETPQTSSAPPAEPTYPDTAEPYAEAVVAAWADDDLSKLGDLTTAQVHEQLIQIPGPLNMEWEFLICDGTAGSSYCRFRNDPGDVLTLRISHTKLGKAHAAVEVKFDAIS